jgi:hypothetical protein
VTGFLGTEPLAVLVVGVVVLAAICARFLLRDPDVRRTRFGFFVERDRYEEEGEDEIEPPWPRNLPSSLDLEDTKETPPSKEEP